MGPPQAARRRGAPEPTRSRSWLAPDGSRLQSRDSAAYLLTSPLPTIRHDSPALVVLPTAVYLEIAGRVALVVKARPSHQREGGNVHGQDVGLDAMETKRPESVAERERERFRHVALPGVGGADPVTEEGALGWPADDLVQVDRPQDRTVAFPANQELLVPATPAALQPIRVEPVGSLAARSRRL